MLKAVALVLVTCLLSLSMIAAFEQSADAAKVIGNKRENKYSYWVGNQVCGDEVCKGSPYYMWHQKYRTFKSPYDTYQHAALLQINSR